MSNKDNDPDTYRDVTPPEGWVAQIMADMDDANSESGVRRRTEAMLEEIDKRFSRIEHLQELHMQAFDQVEKSLTVVKETLELICESSKSP
jgi:septation ring formation regulator EzrA